MKDEDRQGAWRNHLDCVTVIVNRRLRYAFRDAPGFSHLHTHLPKGRNEQHDDQSESPPEDQLPGM